ncbi:MAG TPA: DNA polymerase Y family protein, partial [Burkholderiales bacterium]|nr:DNA polymerase Y family protein [Burkholderiales bacterium]
GRADTAIEVRAASGTGDAEHLLVLITNRLATITLAGPVRALRLQLVAEREVPLGSAALFDDPTTQGERTAALIERLQARLGDGAVYGLDSVADHRPERAQRRRPPADAPGQVPAGLVARPAWLLAVPRPWPSATQRLLSGPERIESGWWDGEDCRRDYHLAAGAAGETVWVYRDLRTGTWYLHGLFG